MSINSKIVIGTAQFGLNYGITNQNGQPSNYAINKIFSFCKINNSKKFDTANAYDSSEKKLGSEYKSINQVKIYTKLPVNIDKNISLEELEVIIYNSLKNLNKNKIECISFHRMDHLLSNKEKFLNLIDRFKKNKTIKKFGVSIQNEKEFYQFIDIPELDYIQLPFNIIDKRWDSILSEYKSFLRNKTVHIRSIFLQGLLLTENKKFWNKTKYKKYDKILKWLNNLSSNYNCKKIDLCLKYVMSNLDWIDGLIFGINHLNELIEIKNKLNNLEPFSKRELIDIQKSRPKISYKLLNPSYWA